MKTFLPKDPGDKREWLLVDANGKVLGRLAVKLAALLRGKNKPTFTPSVDIGDFVVVINANKIVLTGKKEDRKMYKRYSGYRHGLKYTPAFEMRKTHSDEMISLAVKRMLPRNRTRDKLMTRLKVFAGPEHCHEPQKPKKIDL